MRIEEEEEEKEQVKNENSFIVPLEFPK